MWLRHLFLLLWAVDAREAAVTETAVARSGAALLQLPGWNLDSLEQVMEETSTSSGPADEESETFIRALDRRQVRLVMGCIFLGLVGSCAFFLYFVYGSEFFKDIDLTNQMSYRSQGLISWMSLLSLDATVWRSTALMTMVYRFLAWTLFVASLEFLLVSDPSSVDPLRFSEITTVMTVFVSLLLVFFITHSVARWTSCVESFLGLFEAIRALQMQLHALGVSIAKIDRPVRYGLLSAWLLDHTMREDRKAGLRPEIWDRIQELKDPLLHVTESELEDLKKMADPAIQIWVWVASFLGSLAQEGEIPPMASPIYGRLLQIVKSAQDSMKQIRAVREVQVPYVYTHTLAAVVHVSNILCATSMGLTVGSCLGSILVHIDPRLTLYGVEPQPNHSADTDVQVLIIQGLKCFFAPVLYQAFLEIGFCVSTPFGAGAESAKLPIDELISGWLEDVKHANHMAVAPPGWEAPCFKPKDFSGAAAAASKSPKASKGPVTVLPAAAGARRESKMLEALDVARSPRDSPRQGWTSPREAGGIRRAATTEGSVDADAEVARPGLQRAKTEQL